MSFTPNMKPWMVAELDRRRGHGDFSTFMSPDGIVPKKPWLRPDGTHKSTDEEDEMEDQKKPLEKAMEGLEKFVLSSAHPPTGTSAPSGSMTGVASAGGHSGMPSPNASSALSAVPSGAKPPPVPGMKSFTDVEKCGDGIAEMIDGMKDTKKSEPGQAAHRAEHQASDAETNRRFGKRERDIHAQNMLSNKALGEGGRFDAAIKALNSRSMHIPVPLGPYDPYQIAMARTGNPVHVAGVSEGGGFRVPPGASTFKSCVVHGVVHKSDAGCNLCAVQKSGTCKSCGSQLVKTRGSGGGLSCPTCH